jgi:predicted transcriptional regulator
MIAVKISPFRPRIVILHGVRGEVDPLAVGLARHEGIPLAVSKLGTQDEVVDSLLKIYRLTQE